jgi:hypothetical protein
MFATAATFAVRLLLRWVPGLGPFAQLITSFLTYLGSAEAADVYLVVKDLVVKADADPSLASGQAKFDWVLPQALKAILVTQPAVATVSVRLMIEAEVKSLRDNAPV